MSRKTLVAGALIGIVVAALSFAEPVQVGTYSPLEAKGQANSMAKATARAQTNFRQMAVSMGGKEASDAA